MTSENKPKPIVIGIYGISGSGKTHLLGQMKQIFGADAPGLDFYDGSGVIKKLVPGGMQEFNKWSHDDQNKYRERAIETIKEECAKTGKVGLVAGHYMFWHKGDVEEKVGTKKDWETYTHIVYLGVEPDVVAKRRDADKSKKRPPLQAAKLRKWQEEEIRELRKICLQHDILFTVASEPTSGAIFAYRVSAIVKDIIAHNEKDNLTLVENALDEAVAGQEDLKTMLVLDADRTLAPQDTGELFWKAAKPRSDRNSDPLKTLFKAKGYSYSSFRQATLLYEEVADEFDAICDEVAVKVTMYPEFLSLLKRAESHEHIGAVVVTCGVRHVWEKVLQRAGLANIKVIGAGRIADGYVVTGTVKAALVERLQKRSLRVIAFGDSPLDIDMLKKADQAIVVVGDEGTRSSAMEDELRAAIGDGLRARQILLPKNATPRIDSARLPLTLLGEQEIDWILRRYPSVLHATDKNAAKVLMTPMRDASVSGHDLRKAHQKVGYYLATEFLTEVMGIEQYAIPHVQGRNTDGYRLQDESKTLIVPLMRGGEPMAFGVSEALKSSSFHHAKHPEQLEKKHMDGKRTIILVDSVVNSGGSVIEFVDHVRKNYSKIQIVVVAGVVQAGAVRSGAFADMLKQDKKLTLVALRLSENKYKGKGGTDTGHRLFNTTNLD
ncbi:uracil phosphoribosyltransferase-domain-containing protein [Massariosphaeria phaeospora]|uniref:Uracil phosphoribosyltransferase-domain-containing protein n=1 Tax=Massariosphaeria phaeospora TaxID=100035 RepID=A0A7C8I9F2_9PLEO|nr:uracil phosphoribosyltransferase-domain-containing protein [Massariosphaeria phaeospora]